MTEQKKINPQQTILLLDLDGTMLDSKPKLVKDVRETYGLIGVPLEEAVTDDWVKAAEKYGRTKEAFWNAFREVRKTRSWQYCLEHGEAPLFPETLSTLEQLANLGYNRMAIVTRSEPKETNEKLDYHKALRAFFPPDKVFITPLDKKEFPTKIREALAAINHLHLASNFGLGNIYMIGDASDDTSTAADIKRVIPTLVVATPGMFGEGMVYDTTTYGVHVKRDDKNINGADYVIKDLSGLTQIV